MQNACHVNFVIDPTSRSLCGAIVEHWSAESEGLRLDPSWELRNFLCHTLVSRRKTSFFISSPHETIIFSRLFKSIILLTLIGMLFYEKNQGHERRTSNPTLENTYNIWVLLQCKKMLNHD